MCGIVGYVGHKLALPIVLDCLEKLEYRGYDSAGVAYNNQNEMEIIKRVGKIANLKNALINNYSPTSCAIGHTRWATHGEPNESNAHPHKDNFNITALVHNGIVENYIEIKQKLLQKGYTFQSETDTEVISMLLGDELKKLPIFEYNTSQNEDCILSHSTHMANHIIDIVKTISDTLKLLTGSFALAIIIKGLDNYIFVAKNKSPLIIGEGKNEYFVSSDIPALLSVTKKVYHLQDQSIGVITPDKLEIYNEKLQICKPIFSKVDIEPEYVMLGKYNHFMEKEIAQGYQSAKNTMLNLHGKNVFNSIPAKIWEDCNLHITACGTALHSGMVGKYLIENVLRLPVSLDFASEFRYKEPILNQKSILILISQSGETADTLNCLEYAKTKGATTVAVTNVAGSRMESLADYIIRTSAGVEIAVASTKAYVAQLTAMYSWVIYLSKLKNLTTQLNLVNLQKSIDSAYSKDYNTELLPIVNEIAKAKNIYFVGRGLDYLAVLEGALKLKEVSYIPCEAFAGGELKHGSLALIHNNSITIVVLTQRHLIDKTINAIKEIQTRGGKVILFTSFCLPELKVNYRVQLPQTKDYFAPLIIAKPLQTLAYLTSIHLGHNPDKPRNLAKSVTVE